MDDRFKTESVIGMGQNMQRRHGVAALDNGMTIACAPRLVPAQA